MKSRANYSPDIISSSSPMLVPLRNKFKHHDIKEIPGWRCADSRDPNQLRLTSSKPYKVKNKNEYHSPLNFALDERLPFIFPPKIISKKKSKNNKKDGRVLSLKQFNHLREEEKKTTRRDKVSISYVYEEPEHSGDENLKALFSHRSLEILKQTKKNDKRNNKRNDKKAIIIPTASGRSKTLEKSEAAKVSKFTPSFSPDYLSEDKNEFLNKSYSNIPGNEQKVNQRGEFKLPVIVNLANTDQNSRNLETPEDPVSAKSKGYESGKYRNKLLGKGDKIILSTEDREKSRKNRLRREEISSKERNDKDIQGNGIQGKDFSGKDVEENKVGKLTSNHDTQRKFGKNSGSSNVNKCMKNNKEDAVYSEDCHSPEAAQSPENSTKEKNKISNEIKHQKGVYNLVIHKSTSSCHMKVDSVSSNYSNNSVNLDQSHKLVRTHKKKRNRSVGTDPEEVSKISSSLYSLSSCNSSERIEDNNISNTEREQLRIERKKSRKRKHEYRNKTKKNRANIRNKITDCTESSRNYKDTKHWETVEKDDKDIIKTLNKNSSLRKLIDKDQNSDIFANGNIEEGEGEEQQDVNEIVRKAQGILDKELILKINAEEVSGILKNSQSILDKELTLKINGEVVNRESPRGLLLRSMPTNAENLIDPSAVNVKDKKRKESEIKDNESAPNKKLIKNKSSRASAEATRKLRSQNLLKNTPKNLINPSSQTPKSSAANKNKKLFRSNRAKKSTFPDLTPKKSISDLEKSSKSPFRLSITITDDPSNPKQPNFYNSSDLQGIKELPEDTSQEKRTNNESNPNNLHLTVKRPSKRDVSHSSSSRSGSRKSSQELLDKHNSEKNLGEGKRRSKQKWVKVNSIKEIDDQAASEIKGSENVKGIEDENSDLDMSSELSKYSVIKHIEHEQKSLKKKYSSLRENKNKKSIRGLKILTYFLTQEIKRKLKYTDPVKNFISNFSFSILKCMISLVKQSAIVSRYSPHKPSQQKLKVPDVISISSSDMAQGKLKVNKRVSELSTHPIKLQRLSHSKDKKRSTVSPAFYSREIALKTVLSIKNASPITRPKVSVSIKQKEGIPESDSDSSSSSSNSDSDSSSEMYSDPSRHALMYELNHQDITVRIAQQILRGNSKTLNGGFSLGSECSEINENGEECREIDIEQEIQGLAGRLGSSVQQFAFSPQINFNLLKPPTYIYNFRDLEEGQHEVDLENLDKYANKSKFTLHQSNNIYFNDNNSPLRIAAAGEPTENEEYFQRMKKIKMKLKRQQMIADKQLRSHSQLGSSESCSKVLAISPIPLRKKNKRFSPESGIYEERLYLRIKNSPSPILSKPTTQVDYLPSEMLAILNK